jgi:hypothetical protein
MSNSELAFLTAIERGEVVTQMMLTKRIGVSIGLINALLKRGSEYGEIFARARTNGLSRLVLVGRGELAEIAVIAAWSEGLTLLALLDSQTDQEQHYGVIPKRADPDSCCVYPPGTSIAKTSSPSRG